MDEITINMAQVLPVPRLYCYVLAGLFIDTRSNRAKRTKIKKKELKWKREKSIE